MLAVSRLRHANLGCVVRCKHHHHPSHKGIKTMLVPAARWTLHCAWSRSCFQTGVAWRSWAQAWPTSCSRQVPGASCMADGTPLCRGLVGGLAKGLVTTSTSLQRLTDFLALAATGVIQGAIDYYVSAPLQRNKIRAFGKVGSRAGALTCQCGHLRW